MLNVTSVRYSSRPREINLNFNSKLEFVSQHATQKNRSVDFVQFVPLGPSSRRRPWDSAMHFNEGRVHRNEQTRRRMRNV